MLRFQYFESTLVSKSCDPELSIVEDKIRASAKFFGPSCKAGPWVVDSKQDFLLKQRYPSLCQLCNDPYSCDIGDKHWGRRGALYCLTNGGGSVAYARLDDVKSHFGVRLSNIKNIIINFLTFCFDFLVFWCIASSGLP